jgi:hypothetical protein
LKQLELPETRFEVTADSANLHINGNFIFPADLRCNLEPWQFPTNTVHQPMTSFTAIRGFKGWLNGQDWAQSVKLNPSANQIYTWGMNGLAFQTYAAVPTANAVAKLIDLDANIKPIVAKQNARDTLGTSFTLETTNNTLSLVGSPIAVPYIQAVHEPGGDFFLAGAFPNPQKTTVLPQGLFQRLGTPNIIFYHWEITAERFPEALQLSQFALMITGHKQLDGNSAAYKWLAKFYPILGNTDTEVVKAGADEMTFSRKAPGGLTAVEMLLLANWLEAVDFPHCNLDLPPISERLKLLRAKRLNSQQNTQGH